MSLETPDKIRNLQRKLYCKAKAEPYQTGRAVFPHPAFRQVSSQGTRRRHLAHAVQHEHARVSMDLTGKPSDATAGRIVSSTQKGEHAVEDVSINSLMGRGKRAIAEVSGPATQKAV